MAKFQAKTDRKQISIILNLIKIDCVNLYKKFGAKETKLKQVIELYEEFMTEETNGLFQKNNKFSDIVLNHQKHFLTFLDEIPQETGELATHQDKSIADNDIYVLYISLQQWLLQGQKDSQQFYFMIDIDPFNYTQHKKHPVNGCNKVVKK